MYLYTDLIYIGCMSFLDVCYISHNTSSLPNSYKLTKLRKKDIERYRLLRATLVVGREKRRSPMGERLQNNVNCYNVICYNRA